MQTRSLSLTVLLAIVGTACKRQPAPEEQAPAPPSLPPQAIAPATPKADTVGLGWDSPETVRSSGVRYTVPIQVFDALGVTLPDEYFDSIGPGYKIGTFVDGPYRGSDVVSARWRTSEPCKGEGCDDPAYFRFARVGDQLVFLRQNSDGGDYFERQKAKWRLWTGAFAAAGLSLISDSLFAVQAFLAPATMLHGSETFRWVSRRCDGDSLKIAFRHPVFQQVRFDGQLFHVTRPDGSCLTYEYMPYFSEKDIVWNTPPKQPNRSGYSWKKDDTYGRLEVRYDPFVAADTVQIDRDATVVGHTQRGEPVYELKDPNHPLLKGFYKDYEADFAKAQGRDESAGIQAPKHSYEQFLAARPIFLWRDPFGRLTRFTNNDFLPVYLAEPIIYLYPTTALEVHVEAKPLHAISASTPPYRRGWDVLAQPSGALSAEGKRYAYLFWEGLSSISPMRREGFVVPQGAVPGFFERMLPQLGLSERESQDFRAAWLPRFHGAPYYFITFLSRETIDRLAPLVVTPKPDAVIRVLMDFRPLWTREVAKTPDLPKPPERRGFTVVEWGGILR